MLRETRFAIIKIIKGCMYWRAGGSKYGMKKVTRTEKNVNKKEERGEMDGNCN